MNYQFHKTTGLRAARITPGQIRKIHTIKSLLKMTDLHYRGLVMEIGEGFKRSSLDLTYTEAGRLITRMESLISTEPWEHRGPRCLKYDCLGEREGFATPRQLRKIDVMWHGVSRARTSAERDKTLQSFLYNRFSVSDIRFLESWQVQKVIRTLASMKQNNGGD
jgi:hypothetical protein